MSLTNLLKSTGGIISSAKNQYGDIERMFQGYAHNPYITQPSEMYDNAYYPGYIPNNPHGYGLKYGSSAPAGGYGHDQGYGGGGGGGGGHHYQPPHDTYAEVHSYGGGYSHAQPRHKSKGNSSAMSALTLLAFLFFLNILQSCLKEHMLAMNPTVMVMTAGASRSKAIMRENLDKGDADLKDTTLDPITTGDGDEFESDSQFPKSDYIYRKFFNESDIKYQNANNFYTRRPHRS
ncbi:uncharacterized protein LOC119069975 [Bradysia coprophila]|uniref:uncharacterized protein LOC119069975 n=1 Tax=Bradysia coprophila TaxID=38358 RepID=UPI00187D833B|nr:uncharacterized protein LOC119069975 [Bradysia coprophila]